MEQKGFQLQSLMGFRG